MRFGRSQDEVPLHHSEVVLVKGNLGRSPDTDPLEDPHLMAAPAQGAVELAPVVDGVSFRWLCVYAMGFEAQVVGGRLVFGIVVR